MLEPSDHELSEVHTEELQSLNDLHDMKEGLSDVNSYIAMHFKVMCGYVSSETSCLIFLPPVILNVTDATLYWLLLFEQLFLLE